MVALAGAPLFVVLSEMLFGESPDMATQVVLQLIYCGLAVFILWFVVRVERLSLESIGLRRPTWMTAVWGIGLLVVISLVLPPLTAPLQDALGTEGLQAGMDQLAAVPRWFRVVLGVTGGFVEETLYRGYAVERLATITGRRWLGGLISAVIFGLAHVPEWGLGFALAADLPFGVAMTLFYLWRRDLAANIVAHSTGLVIAMVTVVR